MLQVTAQTVSETNLDKLANIEGTGSTPEDFNNTHRKAAQETVQRMEGPIWSCTLQLV
jgi:hypothetical protein